MYKCILLLIFNGILLSACAQNNTPITEKKDIDFDQKSLDIFFDSVYVNAPMLKNKCVLTKKDSLKIENTYNYNDGYECSGYDSSFIKTVNLEFAGKISVSQYENWVSLNTNNKRNCDCEKQNCVDLNMMGGFTHNQKVYRGVLLSSIEYSWSYVITFIYDNNTNRLLKVCIDRWDV